MELQSAKSLFIRESQEKIMSHIIRNKTSGDNRLQSCVAWLLALGFILLGTMGTANAITSTSKAAVSKSQLLKKARAASRRTQPANPIRRIRPTVRSAASVAASQLRIQHHDACSKLVKRVCGAHNECSQSVGCSPAKQLLERYNQDHNPLSCRMSLEDGMLFAACNQ